MAQDQGRSFRIERAPGDGRARFELAGRLELASGPAAWDALKVEFEGEARFDLARIEFLDGAGAAMLLAVRGDARQRGGDVLFENGSEEVTRLLELYGCPTSSPPLRDVGGRLPLVVQVGRVTRESIVLTRDALAFLGQMTLALRLAIRKPGSIPWREVPHLIESSGADGVPIVLMINFLVGLIMGLQAAEQLAQFGASIFVANLVGLSVTRELGPLMTAILVAGRTGAAYAAELGTMKVSEEIDALKTLGLDEQRFLVFPRLIALVIVVPLLTLLADFVGVLGGLFVAVSALDLTAVAYVNQLGGALDLWDVFGGVVKAVVFAITVTLISCQRGLSTRGGAAGVGASTTSAVVSILFTLVLLDALFTVLFNLFGI